MLKLAVLSSAVFAAVKHAISGDLCGCEMEHAIPDKVVECVLERYRAGTCESPWLRDTMTYTTDDAFCNDKQSSTIVYVNVESLPRWHLHKMTVPFTPKDRRSQCEMGKIRIGKGPITVTAAQECTGWNSGYDYSLKDAEVKKNSTAVSFESLVIPDSLMPVGRAVIQIEFSSGCDLFKLTAKEGYEVVSALNFPNDVPVDNGAIRTFGTIACFGLGMAALLL